MVGRLAGCHKYRTKGNSRDGEHYVGKNRIIEAHCDPLVRSLHFGLVSERLHFAERPRSATTPAGAVRAHARNVTAGVVVL